MEKKVETGAVHVRYVVLTIFKYLRFVSCWFAQISIPYPKDPDPAKFDERKREGDKAFVQ